MFEALLMQLLPYIALAAAAIAGLFGIYTKGKSTGKQQIRDQLNAQALQNARRAKEIENSTNAAGGDANREWLQRNARRNK